MRIVGECTRIRGRVVLGSFMLMLTLMTAGAVAASAQVSLPTPPVDLDASELVDELLSPLPSPSVSVEPLPSTPVDELIPDPVNDVISELPLIGDTGEDPAPAGDGGDGTTSPSTGSPGGTTSGGSSTGSSSGSSGGSAPRNSTSVNVDGSGRATGGSAADVRAPYASTAGKAAVAALSRAMRLSGPFAAPILLAIAALGVLIAIGRGSDRLVKVEQLSGARQTYRL